MSLSATFLASISFGRSLGRKLISPRKFPSVGSSRSFTSKEDAKQQQEVVEGRRFFPRRCVMYVPGDSEKMLAKSLVIKPDSLVFDCEDGVAANKKVDIFESEFILIQSHRFRRMQES